MHKWISQRWPVIALTALAVTAVTAGVARKVMASDHQDTPLVENNPRFDVNDVYAFPSPNDASKTVLVLGTQSPLTPAATPSAKFGTRDQVVYQLKIDNTGDAKEDLVFQFTFFNIGRYQVVSMRGPSKPASVGTENTLVRQFPVFGLTNTVIEWNGMKLFAGPRNDPFFIDLEAFFRVLPDRKPENGPLSQIQQGPLTFRPATGPNPAVDFLRGINDMAIVVEVPTAWLTNPATNGRFGVWGTTSKRRS